MIRHNNQQLYTRSVSRFQVLFLGEIDSAVDVQETEDLDVEEIIACIKLGGAVFITSTT